MFEEKSFNKYQIKGPDYHYKQINKKSLHKFNALVIARYEIIINMVKTLLDRSNNKKIKILDAGCGDGVFFYLLKKRIKIQNYELYGIDSSEIALKVATEKIPNGNFKLADIYSLPFEKDYFDIIVSMDVIEHISKPEEFLFEIERVGKNKATVIISTPIRFTEYPLDKFHYYEYFPSEFTCLLKRYFLNVRVVQSHLLRLYLLYNNPISIFSRKIHLYKRIINIITILFNMNPFLKIKSSDNQFCTYMVGIGIVS